MTHPHADGPRVNTVLGPVPADQLGVVAVHEALLSVLPGAQHAPDISMDRAEILGAILAKLNGFRAAGGGAVVDATGMFHGRDLPMLEALSQASGVHIVASTGMGPEELLGGYFLTPQTNPPTPWPAEKFADLFAKEVSEGMVVPRVERRAAAGLVTTTGTREGLTATDESLFRGAARAAAQTGVPLSVRFATDAAAELQMLLDEGIAADRVLICGLDRADASGAAAAVAERGAYVGIDRVGTQDDGYLSDAQRADLVLELVEAGHIDRVLLASGSIGVAKGIEPVEVPYDHVLATFVPALRSKGLTEADAQRLLVDNPRAFLTVR